MFSHLVTAAKGIFARQEPDEALDDPAGGSAANTRAMVTATRRGTVAPEQTANGPDQNGIMTNGKRKARPASVAKTDDQRTKRRKKSSLETADATGGDTTNDTAEKTSHMNESKGNHVRFGSEEPALPEETHANEIPAAPDPDEHEEDSDDDAPEAIDNSAQLLKIKEKAKKQEKARQLEDQLKKEKRRNLDERRKLQAKSAAKSKGTSSPADDLHSESTTTLQGSTTRDTRRRALPTLLPDEILNAEPVARPPTPPAENLAARAKKANKLRFLDKTDEAPKDVKVGDVAIRVLDAPSSKKEKSQPTLAPKASKAGRNVKDNWLKSQRSTAHVNGLRRTAGGPSGFVRR